MSARYLIRLDDACDTADRRKWALMEQMLDRHGVKPIVAIVPDNQDPKLKLEAPDRDFWDRARTWQAKGWTIGMHGHTHLMQPTGSTLLLPYYARSEFAGLSLESQAVKIAAAWKIFVSQGITPQVWVAPAHSFDVLTLEALRAETSIRVVSDGIAWNPYYEYGFHWVPQQMWQMTERRSGLWTVGLHPNDMSEAAIAALGETINKRFADRIACFEQIALSPRKKSVVGQLYHAYFWRRWRRMQRGAR